MPVKSFMARESASSSLLRKLACCGSLLLPLLSVTAHAQSSLLPTIPHDLIGTFELTMEDADTASPIPDGANLLVSLTPGGILCADGVRLPLPTTKSGSSSTLYWQNSSLDVEISLSLATPFTAFGVNQLSEAGNIGNLTGDRIATYATDCGQFENYQEFFEQAENQYPELFPASELIFTQQNDSTTFRFYPATAITLSLSGGIARASGGAFGFNQTSLGQVAALLANNLADLPLPQAAAQVNFDDYYSGTYRLSFQNARSFSPVANGTTLTFVITDSRQLCAGETVLETPLYRDGSVPGVIWSNEAGGYYYALDLIPEPEKEARIETGNISLFSSDGILYGTFTGERTALSAECPDARGEVADLDEINLLFDLAEQHMPALFPGGPTTFNQRTNGYIQRYYKESDVTVRIRDRRVEGKGGNFGTAFTFLGKLDKLIELLRSSNLSIAVPEELVGTYSVTFSAAGSFSPITDGAVMDFAILPNGSLCLAGNILGNPRLTLDDRQALVWTDSNSGFELQLDIADPSASGFSMDVTSLDGVQYGNLDGSKTLVLAQCAGVLGQDIPVDAANTLFALAERYYPSQFPPSALTFNQFDGSRLLRYYPGTGTMIRVSGDTISVQGGVYGPEPVVLGKIAALTEQIRQQQGLHRQSTLLEVVGTQQLTLSGLRAVDKKYSTRKQGEAFPGDSSDATLESLMRQLLGSGLNGVSSFAFDIVTDTEDALVFDVVIQNETRIVTAPLIRLYQLTVSFTRQ